MTPHINLYDASLRLQRDWLDADTALAGGAAALLLVLAAVGWVQAELARLLPQARQQSAQLLAQQTALVDATRSGESHAGRLRRVLAGRRARRRSGGVDAGVGRGAMTRAWTRARRRFATLAKRERVLPITTAAALPLLLGWQLGLDAALNQRRQLLRQMAREQADLITLQQQLQALAARHTDPDAAVRAQLDAEQAQARQADQQFQLLEQSLVQAAAIGPWLGTVLQAQRGLQPTGLRSLPVVSVSELANGKAASGANAANAASAPATNTAGATNPTSTNPANPADAALYRDGAELTVQGSFNEVLACLNALERLPQRVYRGLLRLDAQAPPTLDVTPTVYTLSLQKNWWSI